LLIAKYFIKRKHEKRRSGTARPEDGASPRLAGSDGRIASVIGTKGLEGSAQRVGRNLVEVRQDQGVDGSKVPGFGEPWAE